MAVANAGSFTTELRAQATLSKANPAKVILKGTLLFLILFELPYPYYLLGIRLQYHSTATDSCSTSNISIHMTSNDMAKRPDLPIPLNSFGILCNYVDKKLS